MIDLTITATLRPEILQKTLETFRHCCRYTGTIRPIVNIDPVPTSHDVYYLTSKVMGVVRQFFDEAVFIWPSRPNFCEAVRSVWGKSTSEYVFHLEDDWEFVQIVDLDKCVKMIDDGADFVRIPKRAEPIPEEVDKVGLSPALWRGKITYDLADVMNPTRDPEKQLRPGLGNDAIDDILPCTIAEYGTGVHVRDIGREWMNNFIDYYGNKWRKWDRKTGEAIAWHVI